MIYLDANFFIYAIEQGSRWTEVMRKILSAIDAKALRAVTSELTIAEVMPKPVALRNPDYISKYEVLFSPPSPIVTLPVSRDILLACCHVQAELGIKPMDAIHVATAKSAGCHYFLTEDHRLGRTLTGDLTWLKMSDLA
ncbi:MULTISPECIES: type II toxin-antitoxin system VapC family toxin [Rhodopseudomonas]|uniref:type II toxin-antitoxin system VapC family toxin n=1 Tax=Rhodopseudomonas TaxID=1073 RepID=UPI001364DE30|nr:MULTISPECIES: type II toxin-antitoxin system VapC family toxin [Rhodopseudomonas]MDF3812328.1 type II toxin-antitoxin system VapC family toxin [Rhodopseudomonas sp. BAL398]WOK18166.1 type II toxin-antitoxin system VapC family toxin [Rhodopseudomonas sp. BAL398]